MDHKTPELIIQNRELTITGRWVRTVRLAQEWYEDIDDPISMVSDLIESGVRADIFTFWQRLPDSEPRYAYFLERESIAVLPVTTYENWLKTQINCKTRNLIVRARKKGVVVKSTTFSDGFVRGMTAIFNETPIRQERPFLHYGKSFETVKKEFSRYLFREELIGAYLDDELIGFIMLADAGRFAMLGQIISMVRHRDKSPNNALIAKAVETCEQRHIPFLVYALWPRGTLREFKRHNGFMRVDLPRYYVPLTWKGWLTLKLRFHRDLADCVPERTALFLRDLRSKFYAFKYRTNSVAAGVPPVKDAL